MGPIVPTRIVPSARPAEESPRQVAREFRRRLDAGARLRPAGEARHDPEMLLSRGYTPKYRIDLFDTTFYLTNVRQNPDLRFFVAYVVRQGLRDVFPRIFYKDISLIWRSASHFVRSNDENWIGKGEVKRSPLDGEEYSAEETTDLPLEIQTALEMLVGRAGRVRRDETAVAWVLRRGPDQRLDPYRDFVEPRRRARANPRNRINGGRRIAWFRRRNDPASLRFARGYQPDFDRGVIETSRSKSRLYHGRLQRHRILSRNRLIQYLFFAGPRQAWIIPAQATTTELSSYGVRTLDVEADEDLFVPGYEYHFMDDSVDPPERVSQIPDGFVGAPSDADAARSDASPWLDRLAVIREYRRKVLGR